MITLDEFLQANEDKIRGMLYKKNSTPDTLDDAYQDTVLMICRYWDTLSAMEYDGQRINYIKQIMKGTAKQEKLKTYGDFRHDDDEKDPEEWLVADECFVDKNEELEERIRAENMSDQLDLCKFLIKELRHKRRLVVSNSCSRKYVKKLNPIQHYYTKEQKLWQKTHWNNSMTNCLPNLQSYQQLEKMI